MYDKKVVSLAELGRILAADWEGYDELRLRMKNSSLKWGRGNAEADALAKEVIEGFTSRFVGRPNSRGGVFVWPETLRDAQKHPEKYENLQVRVAGWNVRWNDIPRKEQDEYIRRIETVGGGL